MAKTKALISFAVTAKLICAFVFAYAKIRFSHVAAQMCSMVRQFHMNFKKIAELLVLWNNCWVSKYSKAQKAFHTCIKRCVFSLTPNIKSTTDVAFVLMLRAKSERIAAKMVSL